MDSKRTAAQIQEALKSYVASLTGEDGKMDMGALLGRMLGAGSDGQSNTPEELTKRFAKMYEMGINLHEEIVSKIPFLNDVNNFELRTLRSLSEIGFPFWFATEYFNTRKGDVCSVETPEMCLPFEAIATLYAWKQIAAFVAMVFTVALISGIIGIFLSGRRLKTNLAGGVLVMALALVIDVLGLLSMLVPIAGNLIDVVWAPFAGLLVASLLRSPSAGLLMAMKEIVPFGDMIPLATLMAARKLFE